MHSISKLKAVLLVCLVIVAATTVGYYYYVQTHVSTPSSQVPSPSPSPTSSPTASPSPSPSASPTSQPTATPIQAPTPAPTPTPTPTPGYYLSDLSITPIEPWPGDPVAITAQVTNNEINGSTSVSLNIDDQLVSTPQSIQIASGASETISFTATETDTGTYTVQLSTLTGSSLTEPFNVVTTGYHTLSINTPYPDISFTLDGQNEITPYSNLVPIGNHTIVMPSSVGAYIFQSWADDGDTNPARTIDVEALTSLTADYGSSNGESCPSLYTWNGDKYVYSSEVSDGPGWLGFVDYYQSDGTIVFAYSNPWSYIKLDNTQLQPVNGNYKMEITQNSDEIFYLDSVKLLVVDHSPNVNVYSTRGTYLYNLSDAGTIYTVSTNPSAPVSAINNGQNVLAQISKLDGNGTVAEANTWNTLDLNLGNLTGAQQINLVVNATIGWPTTVAGGDWFSQFASQPGVTPSPPPYMEVKDQAGNWIKVPDDREFPIPPVNANTFVVNLTGLFPTNNYELRICYYQDISFNYIGVDTTSPQPITVQSITPSYADLVQEFSTNSTSTCNFTRYGDVTELLQNADDMYVIGRQGDSVILEFPVDTNPIPKGMVRDYFLVASCWFKGNGLPYMPFTVNPLPFQNMTSYLYPPTESYPYDAVHLAYLLKYDTRSIEAQTTDLPTQLAHDTYNQIKELELLAAYVALATLLASAVIIFAYGNRKRTKKEMRVKSPLWQGWGSNPLLPNIY